MIELTPSIRVAVISHDAGGAEILSSLCRRNNIQPKYALSGPALSIFKRKIDGICNKNVRDALEGVNVLICGTSSPSTFELEGIVLAKTLGIKTIAILDHWINFRERFLLLGNLIIPDEVWVVDEIAEQIALNALSKVNIKLIENPYKEDFLEKLDAIRTASLNNPVNEDYQTVLYVTEPTSEHAVLKFRDALYWGYTEFDAINYFFKNLKKICPRVKKIIIRPHPSEPLDKYDFAVDRYNFQILLSKERELVEEIADADIIAGCNSMAMIAATWAKKQVICAIPPGGRGFSIPPSGIMKLADILQKS